MKEKESIKGDKQKFFGIWFTYNGSYWVADFIGRPFKIKNNEPK
jgi:hypothetical protein